MSKKHNLSNAYYIYTTEAQGNITLEMDDTVTHKVAHKIK